MLTTLLLYTCMYVYNKICERIFEIRFRGSVPCLVNTRRGRATLARGRRRRRYPAHRAAAIRADQPRRLGIRAQSTSPSGIETINSSVQVDGNLQGSVPAAKLPTGSLELTLDDAVKLGLQTNLGVIAAGNSSASAGAQRILELSALLPYIAVNASDTVAQTNLAAYGFKFSLPSGLNFSIPTVSVLTITRNYRAR